MDTKVLYAEIFMKNNKEINSCFIENDNDLYRWLEYVSKDIPRNSYSFEKDGNKISIMKDRIDTRTPNNIFLGLVVYITELSNNKDEARNFVLDCIRKVATTIQEDALDKHKIPNAYCMFTESKRFYVNIELGQTSVNFDYINLILDIENSLEEISNDFDDNWSYEWKFD